MSKVPLDPIDVLRTRFRLRNSFLRNLLAEFFGTFMLLVCFLQLIFTWHFLILVYWLWNCCTTCVK